MEWMDFASVAFAFAVEGSLHSQYVMNSILSQDLIFFHLEDDLINKKFISPSSSLKVCERENKY
jgi:hypothetical protein